MATRRSKGATKKAAARRGRPKAEEKNEIKAIDSEDIETNLNIKESGEILEVTDAKEDENGNKKETVKPLPKKVVNAGVIAAHIFEIDGVQINTNDITTQIYEAYKANGHRIGCIKDLRVYYNFSERRAYYVINGKPENQYVEF